MRELSDGGDTVLLTEAKRCASLVRAVEFAMPQSVQYTDGLYSRPKVSQQSQPAGSNLLRRRATEHHTGLQVVLDEGEGP